MVPKHSAKAWEDETRVTENKKEIKFQANRGSFKALEKNRAVCLIENL